MSIFLDIKESNMISISEDTDMVQVLKDRFGNILGMTKYQGRRENLYDKKGNRIGYYDGLCTYDVYSNLIGEGNLLPLLLAI